MEPHDHEHLNNELSNKNKKPRVGDFPSKTGFGKFRCGHYKRRCKIVAPCCNEIFSCIHCHNEKKNSSSEVNPADWHDLPPDDVKRVICSLCNTEQDVQQVCVKCGVVMGKYFCSICKIFDDELHKMPFHCDECGICRNGGKENMYHCKTCGCCYTLATKDTHKCMENAMRVDCPVCFEFLFNSIKPVALMGCGHHIHMDCVGKMYQHQRFACAFCSKSYCDMSVRWRALDEEIASTPLPLRYRYKKADILCNDCLETSEVRFHVVGLKCPKCSSYNTRKTN